MPPALITPMAKTEWYFEISCFPMAQGTVLATRKPRSMKRAVAPSLSRLADRMNRRV
jgi:hypothetical protein